MLVVIKPLWRGQTALEGERRAEKSRRRSDPRTTWDDHRVDSERDRKIRGVESRATADRNQCSARQRLVGVERVLARRVRHVLVENSEDAAAGVLDGQAE